ncbi:MAG: hypothetical protein AAF810_28280, partial [Cyanobacteria bacterium P01_D01_bin.36]
RNTTMQGSFQSELLVDLPISSIDTGERVYFSIATLGFNPGLQTEEEITVSDAVFFRSRNVKTGVVSANGEPVFSFRARVSKKEKVLTTEDQGAQIGLVDVLTLCIYLEIADKERIPEIVETIVKYRPDCKSDLPS